MMNCFWHPTETPPPNEKDVLVLVEYKNYLNPEKKMHLIIKGFHTDGKTTTDDSFYNWDEDLEYNEELDSYMVPEGWWESVTYSDSFGEITDSVVGWTELPEIPSELTEASSRE